MAIRVPDRFRKHPDAHIPQASSTSLSLRASPKGGARPAEYVEIAHIAEEFSAKAEKQGRFKREPGQGRSRQPGTKARPELRREKFIRHRKVVAGGDRSVRPYDDRRGEQ